MRRVLFGNKKSEQGSLSVDTIVFFSLFFVFFVFMINLMQLVVTQTVLQFALNQTTKEISQYSYIIAKFGYEDTIRHNAASSARLRDNSRNTGASVSDAILSLNELGTSIESLKSCSLDSLEGAAETAQTTLDIVNSTKNAYNKTNTAYEAVDQYIDYLTTDGLNDALRLLDDLVTQGLSSYVSEKVVQNRVVRHLNTLVPGGNADAMLKNMGVVDGVNGLSISPQYSSFYDRGSKDLNLVMQYKINIRMPFYEMNTYTVTLRASTGLW